MSTAVAAPPPPPAPAPAPAPAPMQTTPPPSQAHAPLANQPPSKGEGTLRPGLAEAAKMQTHFEKTGERLDLQPKPAAPKPDAPKPAPKPEAAKPAAKPQTPLPGGLAALTPKDTPAAKPGEGDEEASKEQSRWMDLRAKEKLLAEIEPKYKGLSEERTKWEEEKAALQKDRTELEELRRQRDFTDVKKSKRYLEEVETPYQEIASRAQEVAEYAGVDVRALMQAMQNPNSMLREDALTELLQEAKRPVKPGNIAALVEKGSELLKLFGKVEEFEKEASLQKAQYENGQNAAKLKAETEAKEVRTRAHKEIRTNILAQGADVLGSPEFKEIFKEAYKMDVAPDDVMDHVMSLGMDFKDGDPMPSAFNAQAQYYIGPLITHSRNQASEIATLKAEIAELTNARPGIKPTAVKPAPGEGKYTSLAEAAAAHKQQGHQT